MRNVLQNTYAVFLKTLKVIRNQVQVFVTAKTMLKGRGPPNAVKCPGAYLGREKGHSIKTEEI